MKELPPVGKEVLLFDNKFNRWRICRIGDINGDKHWISDAKLYFPLDSKRFIEWIELPENPK